MESTDSGNVSDIEDWDMVSDQEENDDRLKKIRQYFLKTLRRKIVNPKGKVSCHVCKTQTFDCWTSLKQHAKTFKKKKALQHLGYFHALQELLGSETPKGNRQPRVEPEELKKDEIVWPPVIIVENTRTERLKRDNKLMWAGLEKHELKSIPAFEGSEKIVPVYGPMGHTGRCLLVFPRSEAGFINAQNIHRNYSNSGRGIDAWEKLLPDFRADRKIPELVGPDNRKILYVYLASVHEMRAIDPHKKLVKNWVVGFFEDLVVVPVNQRVDPEEQNKVQLMKYQLHSQALQIQESERAYAAEKEQLAREAAEANARFDSLLQQHREYSQAQHEALAAQLARVQEAALQTEKQLQEARSQVEREKAAREKAVKDQQLRVAMKYRFKLAEMDKIHQNIVDREKLALVKKLNEEHAEEKKKLLEQMKEENNQAETGSEESCVFCLEVFGKMHESGEALCQRAALECGHANLCRQCAKVLYEHADEKKRLCPMCRAPITQKPLNVFT